MFKGGERNGALRRQKDTGRGCHYVRATKSDVEVSGALLNCRFFQWLDYQP
jgi:hypothetical protein